jgi:uncharacterized protein (TIGR03435 family)
VLCAVNVALESVIADSCNVRSDQVVGEPAWADDLRWDIAGKSTELTADELRKLTQERRSEMMQQLLAERFRLQAHLENRAGTVFALIPAKGGVQLNPTPMTAEEIATGKVADSGLRITGGQTTVMTAAKVPFSLL